MRTFLFASKSSSATHRVRTHNDGTIVQCSCRGYRASGGECVHVKTVRAAFDSGDPSMLAEERDAQPGLFEPSEAPAPIIPPVSTQLSALGFVDPMLASALADDKTIEDYAGSEWVLEEKYNGHRLIVRVIETETGQRLVSAWSRAGNLRVLPKHLIVAAQDLASGTYDGELYVPGEDHSAVTDLAKQDSLRLVFFDLLRVGAAETFAHEAISRRRLLETACSLLDVDSPISIAPQFPVSRSGLEAIWARGGEGAVIKHHVTTYRPGKRVREWVKFKKFLPGRAKVVGFLPGKLGPCSIVVGEDKNGIEVRVKAKNDEWRARFEANPGHWVGKTMTFEYQGQTSKGKYKSAMVDHIEKLD